MSENNLPVRHVMKFHRLRVFPFGWNSDTAVSRHCMSTYRDIKFRENWNINSFEVNF